MSKKSYLVHVAKNLDIYYIDCKSLIYNIPYKLRHREDGPAVIYANGKREWYIMGEKVNCSSQEEFEKLLKLKAFW